MSEDQQGDRVVELPKVELGDMRQLSVSVAEALKGMIRSGVLRPGDRLPNEETLCEHFGVSRITLREAMQMLRGLGLVEPTRGRGTFIREPDPELLFRDLDYFTFRDSASVADVFEVRTLLESHAVTRAAIDADEVAKNRLVDFAHQGYGIVRGAEESDLQKLSELDTEFHKQIAVMSGNLVLEQLIHRTMQILDVVRFRALVVPGQAERSWRQHLEIAEAIRDGDGQLAVSLVLKHVDTVKSALAALERD